MTDAINMSRQGLNQDKSTGHYYPVYKDYELKGNLQTIYTNFKVSTSLSRNTSGVYSLLITCDNPKRTIALANELLMSGYRLKNIYEGRIFVHFNDTISYLHIVDDETQKKISDFEFVNAMVDSLKQH